MGASHSVAPESSQTSKNSRNTSFASNVSKSDDRAKQRRKMEGGRDGAGSKGKLKSQQPSNSDINSTILGAPSSDVHSEVFKLLGMDELTGTRRLRSIVLPNAEGITDVKLLHGERFVRYVASGGALLPRQVMESAHAELYCTAPELAAILADMDSDGPWDPSNDFVPFPAILVLSYAWMQTVNPDPKKQQMQLLAKFLLWYHAQRLWQQKSRSRKTGAFGLMIDFASLFQQQTDPFTQRERASFGRAQHNMGVLYAHALTMTVKITKTPEAAKAAASNRAYEMRGWTLLERRLGDLITGELSVDISNWKEVEAEFGRAFDFATCSAMDNDDLVEALKSLVTRKYRATASMCASQDPVLSILRRHARQDPPVAPEEFQREAQQREFSVRSDAGVVAAIYAEAAGAVFGEADMLQFCGPGFGAEQWGQLSRSLPRYAGLQTLSFVGTGMRAAHLESIIDGFERQGVLPLRVLSIVDEVGPEGAAALGVWMLGGQLGSLRDLLFAGGGVGVSGCRHLAQGLHQGVGGHLRHLRVEGETLAGQAMAALFPAEAGTLPALEELCLANCKVSEAGWTRLADALEEGAMPRLLWLSLIQSPAPEQSRSALKLALQQRSERLGGQPLRLTF